MALKTRYISVDEFTTATGINLEEELKDDANPSDKAIRFIYNREMDIETFIGAMFYRNTREEFARMSDFQKEHFKRAIIQQGMYVLENGDIANMSGMQDGQITAQKLNLNNIIIGERAKQELMVCGLWCRKVKNVGRGANFNAWWMY